MSDKPKKGSNDVNESPERDEKMNNGNNSSQSPSSEQYTSQNSRSSKQKSSIRFRDFLAGAKTEFNPSNTSKAKNVDVNNDRMERNRYKSSYKNHNSQNSNSTEEKDSHEFHITESLMKFNLFRKFFSKRDRLIKTIGGVIGSIFVLAGVLHILGSAARVADNVIFGERAVVSAFLILIGVLILAASFANKLWRRTFLNNIQTELQEAEEESEDKSGELKDESKEKSLSEPAGKLKVGSEVESEVRGEFGDKSEK